jgi:hypothetical protein
LTYRETSISLNTTAWKYDRESVSVKNCIFEKEFAPHSVHFEAPELFAGTSESFDLASVSASLPSCGESHLLPEVGQQAETQIKRHSKY